MLAKALLLFCLAPSGEHQTQASVSRVENFEPRQLLHSGRVIGFQVLLDSLHPRSMRASRWSRGSCKDLLGTCFIWHSCNEPEQGEMLCLDNSQKVWLLGCPSHLIHTWWYHLIPNSFRKHHWSRASIMSMSLVATAQHSESYSKMGKMQVLYSCLGDSWLPDPTVYILAQQHTWWHCYARPGELWFTEWIREAKIEKFFSYCKS